MQRFVAVATEYNVLNLVALSALADPGDEVLILADPHAGALSWDTRLAQVLKSPERGLIVRTESLDHASVPALLKACDDATSAWPKGRRPESITLLAIGGRKHDMLVMHEMLRRRCQAVDATLSAVSVDRRPFMLRISRLAAGDIDWQVRELGSLPPERRVSLDEVLTVHGYRRTEGKGMRVLDTTKLAKPSADSSTTGEGFERSVLNFVQQFLPRDLKPLVSELWWGAEVFPVGTQNQTATEFDVLLLVCDGSVVHIECKGGANQGLQRKTFQMRRAFTPESSIILCRAVSRDDAVTSSADRRRSVLNAYANLGAFGLIQLDPHTDPKQALPSGLPSPASELKRILRTTWLPAE